MIVESGGVWRIPVTWTSVCVEQGMYGREFYVRLSFDCTRDWPFIDWQGPRWHRPSCCTSSICYSPQRLPSPRVAISPFTTIAPRANMVIRAPWKPILSAICAFQAITVRETVRISVPWELYLAQWERMETYPTKRTPLPRAHLFALQESSAM